MIIFDKCDAAISPNDEFVKNSYISSIEEYKRLYDHSIQDPESFWLNIAKEFYWESFSRYNLLNYNFDLSKGPVYTDWFKGSKTNICYNVLDRIIEQGFGDNIAYYWEGNDQSQKKQIDYKTLRNEVCKFSNLLKSFGIKQGDKVAIYMPVTIELVIAMLGCARIGAVHSVIFAGFSSEALAERILDANCLILITADGSYRGDKFIPLKTISDKAVEICNKCGHNLKGSIVLRHVNLPFFDENNNVLLSWDEKFNFYWDELMDNIQETYCEPVWLPAEDPLFILYTSGSTGKPKGIVHSIGGYMVYSATTFKYVFNYMNGDVVFCTADLGWMAGQTINVYGSLANGSTNVLFEGFPMYPHPGRLWEIIDYYKVNTFYFSPTAIRALMKFGDDYVKQYNRSSLKLLGVAGEPINPEAWYWFYYVVGNAKCPIVDTYWQTETGAPMLTSLPGCIKMKPGSASLPFFGVVPAVLNDNGIELKSESFGNLAFKNPWPGIAKTIYGNHQRFEMTYFHKFPGYYFTGDAVYRDKDNYYWIKGRIDDMINVSGHLLSTAEVESAIVGHDLISEAAAVSAYHYIKGECLYCFVVLKDGYKFDTDLERQLKSRVRDKIGPIADPDIIHPVSALPKTRSGKIMRRVLSKIVNSDTDLGDISTMADESILDELYNTRHLYNIK